MSPALLLFSAGVCLTLGVGQAQLYREDGRCGPNYPAPGGGGPAQCEYIAPFPTCCQASEYCGWDCDDAAVVVTSEGQQAAAPAAKPAKTTEKPIYVGSGKYRQDGRCGPQFPLESTGEPAECDPNSQYWCCSENGWCGGSQEHCYCDTCVNYRPVDLVGGKGTVRSDRRCGPEFPLDDKTPSECDGESGNYCCSKFGYCGPGPDHCDCPECVDYRTSGSPKAKSVANGRVRNDRRCGKEFPLDDGEPSECDPLSANPCCSKWGYCGPGSDHCSCPECVDYRPDEQKQDDFVGNVRKDRRCGKEFPLPGGSGKPSQCDPKSDNYCCSQWGYCGGDADHCDCPTCFNYRLVAAASADSGN